MTTENLTSTTTTSAHVRGTSPPAGAAGTPRKSDTVIKLLLRAKGATSLELIAATDWQAHSVRAFLSGLRKKGRVLVREARKSGDLAYRIKAAAKSAVDDMVEAPANPSPAAGA